MDRGDWRATVHGDARVRHDLATKPPPPLDGKLKKCNLLFSCSVMSNALWPHGLQHDRLHCPSLSPRVCSNSYPLSRWCHPPFHPLSSPSPPAFNPSQHQSFPMSQLFASDGQIIEASASALVLPMNIQDWFPLDWLVWSCSPRDSQESSSPPEFKRINSSALSFLDGPTLTSTHDYWKNHSFY